MASYRQFLFSLKSALTKALGESGLSLKEVSKRTCYKEAKLVSIIYGKASFRINDLLDLSRALETRCVFSLKDSSGMEYLEDNEATLIYSDCSRRTIEERKEKLRRQIERASKDIQKQLYLELELLERENCNNPMQRYLIFRKVSAALFEMGIDRTEAVKLLNISSEYFEKLENGEANFSMELLYRLSSVTEAEWTISLTPWLDEVNIG